MTLAALARRVDRSVGFSQVERGPSDLGIADLRAAARALDVPLSWFLVDEVEAERGRVVRWGRRGASARRRRPCQELLSPDLGGNFEVIHCVFEAGAESPEPVTRDRGDRLRHERRAGAVDRRTLPRLAGAPPRWRNPGSERAEVVFVIAPPTY